MVSLETFLKMPLYSLILIFIFIVTIILLLVKKLFRAKRPYSLWKKHVLVTGGSSGIGLSTAIQASRLGAHVTIIARNEEKLKEAVEEIKNVARNPKEQMIQYIPLDLTTDFRLINQALGSAEESTGPVFLLVNCAGMAICGKFENATPDDFRHIMDLNYFGTVFPTLSVAKRMKSRKNGHIVITGSQASLLGIYGMSAYCASKFALRGFAESLYMELKPFNVSVTLCLPPDTDTPGFANEEKSKPEISRLISKTAGLFKPDAVAHQLLTDALNRQFFSTLGLESFMLTTLCAGMSPIVSLVDIILQILLMSFLRLVSVGYLLHFQKIINTHVIKPLIVKKKDLEKIN